MTRVTRSQLYRVFISFLIVLSGCSAVTPNSETPTQTGTTTEAPETAEPSTDVSTPTAEPTPTSTATPSREALSEQYGPWLGEDTKVAVHEDASEGLRPDVQQAINWWESNDDYLPYKVNLELINDTDEADIVVRHTDKIATCGYDDADEIRGCADLLDPDEPAPNRAYIQIERGIHPEVQPHVVRHEFGHVLGLPHQLSPEIMQSPAEYYITDLQDRDNPWAEETLLVYVDLSDYGGPGDRFNDQVSRALSWYEQGAADNMDYNIRFERTSNRSKADIVITGAEFDDLDTAASYDYLVWNADSDPEAEWYHRQRINVTDDAQTSAVGWYVAWSLWETVGTGDRPYELEPERDYHYRRSSWWREE